MCIRDSSIFRAIETGKYVVRSANNGIAAIINPLGVIEQSVNYGLSGFIDLQKINKIYNKIINPKTIFPYLENIVGCIFLFSVSSI